MFFTSIRWRIQVWHGFLLVCLVGALTVGFYSYEQRVRFRELDAQLHELVTPLLPHLGGGPPGRRRGGEQATRHRSRPQAEEDSATESTQRVEPPSETRSQPERSEQQNHLTPALSSEERENFEQPSSSSSPMRSDSEMNAPSEDRSFPLPPSERKSGSTFDRLLLARFDTTNFYYVTFSPDGNVTGQSASAPPQVPSPESREASDQNTLRTRGAFRELLHFNPSGGCVIVGASIAPIISDLHRLAFGLTVAGLGVIAAGLVGGWWLAGRALRPISEISSVAAKIAEGNLSKRISIRESESELGQLSTALNHTFERLENLFEQQTQFTADASHELRTPISVILTQTQLALTRERSPEEYRQTLQACERAAERMRTLVNQLLELARVDSGEVTVLHEDCDLEKVGRDALEFIKPLAENKKCTLRYSLESIRTRADVMKLGQMLVNLLNNAILHNEPGIEVCLTIKRNNSHAVLRVSDNGIGIPGDALPHLFDRFYRVDKARSRKKGSSGLGLAICKSIVEAHGGSIKVESKPGSGTAFTIQLPLEASEKSRTLS